MKSVQRALARRGRGEKGFTLVELLVVVIIIGILAAIAVPIYLNQRKAAWKSSVQSDVKNASLVIETAATQNNGSVKGLAITPTDGKCDSSTTCKVGDDEITVSKNNTLTITAEDSSKAFGTTTDYKIVGVNTNDSSTQVTYLSTSGKLS